MLTNAVSGAGRALLALLLRLDLGAIAGKKGPDPDTGLIMRWITAMVTNFELVPIWMLIWICLHVGAILVGRFVLGTSHGSLRVLVPIEVFPGFMLALALLRLALSFPQFLRVSRAVGQARRRGVPPPAWTQQSGLLLLLASPSDVDFLIDVGLIALIELLIR